MKKNVTRTILPTQLGIAEVIKEVYDFFAFLSNRYTRCTTVTLTNQKELLVGKNLQLLSQHGSSHLLFHVCSLHPQDPTDPYP